ncbi:MAG: VWA domain-containing protein [Myxococcales bacterium]|nr:VWA domain-containing protein [Myxococcales bacterium]
MRRLASALTLCLLIGSGCTPTKGGLRAPAPPTPTAPATTVAPVATPQLVGLDAALDRETLTADREGKLVARLRLDASGIALRQRPPVDLTLVVDTSGSMLGEPIEDARAAALALLDGLRDGDRLTVVTFDSRAQLLVAPIVVDRSALGPVKEALGKMEARGTTDLAAGLQLAMQQTLASGLASEAVRRIVVLGDGVPNDAGPIPQQIATAKGYGIAISTLGFGLEYDEVLLAQIAQGTGGRFHRIDADESIATAFRDEVLRIERAVASNVVLRLQPGPGVSISRIIGHPSAPDATRGHTVQLADLAEGQSQEIFVELTTTAHRSGATVELLDAAVSYEDHTAGAGRLERTAFVASTASDAPEAQGSREVGRGVALARVAAASIDAIAMARAGDFAGAEALLEDAEAQARKLAKTLDEAALLARADELATLRKTITDDRKRQQKAERDALRAAKREQPHPTAGGPLPMPTPAAQIAREPMPAGDLATVKQAHSRAVDTLQPR